MCRKTDAALNQSKPVPYFASIHARPVEVTVCAAGALKTDMVSHFKNYKNKSHQSIGGRDFNPLPIWKKGEVLRYPLLQVCFRRHPPPSFTATYVAFCGPWLLLSARSGEDAPILCVLSAMPCHIKLDIFKSDHALEGEQQQNTTCEQQKAEKQHTDIRPPSLFPHL